MRAVFLAAALLAMPVAAQQVHELCSACHNSQVDDFRSHKHFAAKLSCDACHGQSVAHRESQGDTAPDKVAGPTEQPAVCGACHTAQAKEYRASKHGELVMARAEKRAATCTICHGHHALRPIAAMQAQCARCHTDLPASCKKPPPSSGAKLSCANCHGKHTLVAKK
jgi:hypothetical protein